MSSTRQRGAALLFFLVAVGISLLVLFAGSLNANKVTLDRHRTTSQTLAQTKDALMSWSVAPTRQPTPIRTALTMTKCLSAILAVQPPGMSSTILSSGSRLMCSTTRW